MTIETTMWLLACDVQSALVGWCFSSFSPSLFSLFVLLVVGGIVSRLQLLLTGILTSSLHTNICAVAKPWRPSFLQFQSFFVPPYQHFLSPGGDFCLLAKHYHHLPQIISKGPPAAFQRTNELTFGSTGQRACSNTCFRLFIPSLPPRWSYFWSIYIAELARLTL